MAVNKVVYDGRVLIDLTDDTVSEDKLLVGTTAHDKSGNIITGTYEELDISVETAEYTSGLNAQDIVIDQITAVLESQFVVPSNLQNKSVIPSTSKQVVTADAGYDALSAVAVEAIPQSYTDQIYQNGYDAGGEVGYSSGYDDGYDTGYYAGFDAAKPYKCEVEYVESTGTQYFNTDFAVSPDNYKSIRFALDMALNVSGNTNWPVSGYSDCNGKTNTFYIGTNTNAVIHYGNNAGDISAGATYTGGRMTWILDTKNGTYKVGSLLDMSGVAFNSPTEPRYIYICAYNVKNTSANCHASKIYGGQIHVNDILMRDYVPVLDWDDVPCLYDKVKRKMYYNAGSGNFLYHRMVELPYGYTQLEYIQSNGTQYIDTGFIPDSNTRLTCDFEINTNASNYRTIFGSREGDMEKCFSLFVSQSNAFYSNIGNKTATYTFASTLSGLGRHKVDANRNVMMIDGVSYTHTATTFKSARTPIYLFANNENGTANLFCDMRLYECKIYDNNTLIRDYIPCINASGEVGLYDLVNDKFYGNAGSGTFTYA